MLHVVTPGLSIITKCMQSGLITFALFAVAPTTLLAEGPSQEDTVAWIFHHLEQQELVRDSNKDTGIFQSVQFSEGHQMIMVEIEFGQSDGTAHRDYKAQLTDLSPEIKISDGHRHVGKTLTLSCRQRKCATRYFETPGGGYSSTDPVGFVEIWVTSELAERMRKALSHLVRISGGRKRPPGDLF